MARLAADGLLLFPLLVQVSVSTQENQRLSASPGELVPRTEATPVQLSLPQEHMNQQTC